MNSKKNDDDFYKNLITTRNESYNEITKALKLVEKFIIEKKLVLVGGMAIDLALKLKGDRIYNDNQVPDYDFYSTDHAADAYELGSLLCKEGFENVQCISALHITTMRVRVDFETVADITYCPVEVFNKIPTLNYNKLKIVHPHWQMIDQHIALSKPFENFGREVIFHRWEKDMERYDKLYSYYPIELDDKKCITVEKINVPFSSIKNSCICDWGGIDYILNEDSVILSIPKGFNITVASDDYKTFIKDNDLTIVEYRSEYFGILPRYILCESNKGVRIKVYDTYGILLSARLINAKFNVYMCNIQFVMVYILLGVFRESTDLCKKTYIRCREIVKNGEYPSIEVYGKYNFTSSYLNLLKNNKEKIYNIKADKLQPSRMFPSPPECINNKSFNYDNEYFKIDGRKLEEFMEYTLEPYPEFTNNTLKK